MEKAGKKSILILITNPFAALNVIHSGLANELEKWFSISVISDFLSEADIRHLNSHFGLEMVPLRKSLPRVSRLENWLRTCQMLAFAHCMNLGTVHTKLREQSRIAGWIFSFTQRFWIVRQICVFLTVVIRNWLINRAKVQGATSNWNFSAVISSSPLDIRENKLSNALILRNIPCISMIISWDNLSSKGVMNVDPTLVLVWSNIMAGEYARLYGIFGYSAIVRPCGVPRFDIYFKTPGHSRSLIHLKEQLGIPPAAKVILFCTGAAKHHVCQNYIMDDLLEYAATNPNLAFIIRCHPGDEPNRYRRYTKIKNIHLFQPFCSRTGNLDCPPANFANILKLHLTMSDVCVQVASTMYLDASACNKPTINIAYDAQPNMPYTQSVRRFYDYSHQAPLRQLPDPSIVYNRQELFEKLDEVLHCRKPFPDFRTKIRPIIHHCSPNAVRVAARHIRKCAV